MKKTAILITTYNRRLITLKCIESLKKNSKFDSSFDIYIADSNSKDKTLQEIKRLNPEIKVFNVGDNFFWSQGMNLAWKKARETYEYDFYLKYITRKSGLTLTKTVFPASSLFLVKGLAHGGELLHQQRLPPCIS